MSALVNKLQSQHDITLLMNDPRPPKWPLDAENLLLDEPDEYLGVVESLGNGDSIDKVAKEWRISKAATRAIATRHPSILDAQRASIARNINEGAQLVSERLIEKIDDVSPNKLMFALDVLVKNAQLLSGGVTSRHEQVNVASPEALQKMFEQLPEANATDV